MPTVPSATLDVLPTATARIDALRTRVAEIVFQPVDRLECELAAARSWQASGNEGCHILRRGRMTADILRSMTPVISDGELLVGKFSRRPLTPHEIAELDEWRRVGFPATSKAYGQRDHMAIDYERVLRLGIAGIKEQIARYRSRLNVALPVDMEKDYFYQACLEALEGVITLAHKYADLAEKQAAEVGNPTRQMELHEIARMCRKVPEYPAATFAEAMQSIYFLTFCLRAGCQLNLLQFGRPDRYLFPYYLRDRAEGTITLQSAQELIDCLGLLLNETTERGLAIGYMVGGRDEAGLNVTNDLTYLFINAIDHVRLAYPGVGLCWNSDMPSDVLRLACRLLAKGYSHPAIFNDSVISDGLLQLGLSHRDACSYIHSTCVEITPIGLSNVYVASPYYNLMQCLHDVLAIPAVGGEARELPEYASFDALLTQFQQRLGQAVRHGVIEQNTCMMSRAQGGGFPLLSCLVNDCLARGRDIDHGGARVNWLESSFVGLANLIDALYVIRQLVFIEHRITLARLRDALLANFQGHADVLALIGKMPKYGNDDDRVDLLACDITEMIRNECAKYRSYWGDAVVPGLFCWIMHERLGLETCASADGRMAGFPFADGSGPAQGRERLGPTAMTCSVTKWNHAPMIGGIAVNMRFHTGRTSVELHEPMQAVLETFLRQGGFEAQVNVVDAETLHAAQQQPELYRDLVVRVAGYSDYFVGLSAEMQAEVMARAEHHIVN
ncbi:MAG TPA: pyruvate formate lyase family protein [Armatimonadota bacterium]|nr:pyruvate formate lyase family protein [Armatimonadota bacterium]